MHNAALAKLRGRDSRFSDWAYYRFDVPPERFAEAIPLFHQHNFLGLNLTIPHKVQALDLIEGISPDGGRMGAVNTLMWDEFGYDGFNTDGYGLKQGLLEDLGFEMEEGRSSCSARAGGSRGSGAVCVLEKCEKLYVGNRSVERLEDLMSVVRAMPGGERVEAFALGEPPSGFAEPGCSD